MNETHLFHLMLIYNLLNDERERAKQDVDIHPHHLSSILVKHCRNFICDISIISKIFSVPAMLAYISSNSLIYIFIYHNYTNIHYYFSLIKTTNEDKQELKTVLINVNHMKI